MSFQFFGILTCLKMLQGYHMGRIGCGRRDQTIYDVYLMGFGYNSKINIKNRFSHNRFMIKFLNNYIKTCFIYIIKRISIME